MGSLKPNVWLKRTNHLKAQEDLYPWTTKALQKYHLVCIILYYKLLPCQLAATVKLTTQPLTRYSNFCSACHPVFCPSAWQPAKKKEKKKEVSDLHIYVSVTQPFKHLKNIRDPYYSSFQRLFFKVKCSLSALRYESLDSWG